MAEMLMSPPNRDFQDYYIWNSEHRSNRLDTERYVLRAQDITEAVHSMRESRMARPKAIDPYSYMTTTTELTANHPVAEIHKRMEQFEQYGQSEFRRLSGDHVSLITRVDQLLHQVENQNAAIIELSRIIDELKQDGFQPPEPLEDVD